MGQNKIGGHIGTGIQYNTGVQNDTGGQSRTVARQGTAETEQLEKTNLGALVSHSISR